MLRAYLSHPAWCFSCKFLFLSPPPSIRFASHYPSISFKFFKLSSPQPLVWSSKSPYGLQVLFKPQNLLWNIQIFFFLLHWSPFFLNLLIPSLSYLHACILYRFCNAVQLQSPLVCHLELKEKEKKWPYNFSGQAAFSTPGQKITIHYNIMQYASIFFNVCQAFKYMYLIVTYHKYFHRLQFDAVTDYLPPGYNPLQWVL